MNILYDDEKGEIWIGQPIYTENLLKNMAWKILNLQRYQWIKVKHS